MTKRKSMQGDTALLGTGPIGRLLWDYSLPAVIGMVINSCYNVMDRIFIGQGVGPDAIAGLAITFPVMNLATAIGVLVGVGAAARTSIMLGAGDRRGAGLVLGNALVLTFINGIIYIGCFGLFMDSILRAFGASDATLPYAHDFMMWLLPGLLMMNLTFGFNNVMRASGYPIRAMVTLFIGTGINLVLAPTFIFGLGWGIKGAAIATDIAMTVTTIFVMGHFLMPSTTLRFTRGIYRLRWPVVVSIVAIGAAPSIVNLAGSAINAIINTTLYRYGGDNAVGAAGIFTTYTSMLCMIVVGICQGMQPIVGYNYGAGHTARLKRAFMLTSAASTVVVTVGCVFGLLFPSWIARAFTTDARLIEVTRNALSIALCAFWMVGFQIVATSFFQSIGKAGRSIFLSLTRQVIFLIPLLLWLPRMLALDGVWTAFPVSDCFATAVTAILIVQQMRTLRAKRPDPLAI